MAAGLLDDPTGAGCGRGEGLTQCQSHWLRVDRDVVPGTKPVDHEVSIRLAEAPDDGLPRRGDLLKSQRRILGEQPCEGSRQLVVIPGGVSRDGDGKHGLGHLPWLHEQGGRGRRQRVTRLRATEPAHRHDASGNAPIDGLLLGAQRGTEQPDALIDIVVLMPSPRAEMARHVHRIVRAQRP